MGGQGCVPPEGSRGDSASLPFQIWSHRHSLALGPIASKITSPRFDSDPPASLLKGPL